MSDIFARANAAVRLTNLVELRGVVTDVTGLVVEASGPFVPMGTQVSIKSGTQLIPAQVVGFKKENILMMPYGELEGVAPGALVTANDTRTEVPVSDALLGRVVDGLGVPIDGGPPPLCEDLTPLYRTPPNPVTRTRIHEPFDLGVRPINALLTVGAGQRVGIMAGSGVGKSTLLGMIARNSVSDINVISLVGERGREVREFLERDLGEEGAKRSVIVVATGDTSALVRLRAAFLATAYAEYFRDKGKKVVLMMDSVTRLAMAQREIGLAIGEPPSTKGYTPSVFAMLPRLLERAGTSDGEGSITGLYTVLVEGDDMNEPIADATRGILDGHIVLSRRLAGRGHFPAIEILESASRVMNDIVPPEGMKLASMARDVLATYREAEDLITIGAYKPGQNPRVDRAVQLIDKVTDFLKQPARDKVTMQDSWRLLQSIFAQVQG